MLFYFQLDVMSVMIVQIIIFSSSKFCNLSLCLLFYGQCCCGSGHLLPKEESVLHATDQPWKPVQHQPGKRRSEPHQVCRLRERSQLAHPAGPSLRIRHRPQQRRRGTHFAFSHSSGFTDPYFNLVKTVREIFDSTAPDTAALTTSMADPFIQNTTKFPWL